MLSSTCATLAAAGLFAAPANADPIRIPLNFLYSKEDQGQEQISRLTIQLGMNGGAARTFMFDTGSSALVGQLAAEDPNAEKSVAGYGDGSYGNLVQWVIPQTLDYTTSDGVGGHFGGKPEARNSLTRVVLEGGATYLDMKKACTDTPDKCDLSDSVVFQDVVTGDNDQEITRNWWAVKSSQDAVKAGQPAEDDGTYGVFGAGNFIDKDDRYSALGATTTSGYVISANANLEKGETPTPGCTPCVTLNLNASLRAQFDTLLPWNVTHGEDDLATFPGSGANASTQYEGSYSYTFTFKVGEELKTATFSGPALLDTGTAEEVYFTQSGAIESLKQQGLDLEKNKDIVIESMTITGAGGQSVSLAKPTLSRLEGEDNGDSLVVGLPFFLQTSVIYDLANKVTGYSAYFVSAEDFTTDAGGNGRPQLHKVTAEMGNQMEQDGQRFGMLGLAGIISGSGGLTIGSGADVRMSGVNSYTGATVIEDGAQLHLAGPGSIAQSSKVVVDGWLNLGYHGAYNALWGVEGSDDKVAIRSLAGSGEVALFSNTLVLTHAGDVFAGKLSDEDIDGTSVRGKLTVAGGKQTLSGQNTFTGLTTVGASARLMLTRSGSLVGDVAVHGEFGNDGNVAASTAVHSGGTLAGSGILGDVTIGQGGTLAPGSLIDATQKAATISINGDLIQQAGSTYVIDLAGGLHDSVVVAGSALIEAGAKLAFASDPELRIGETYEVLTAAGGITGSYELSLARISAFVAPAQRVTDTSLSVTAVQDRALASAALTGNQIETAAAADTLSLDHKVREELLYLDSDADARAAFDSLSGESIASIRAALLDDSAYLERGILRRVSGGLDLAALDEERRTTMWMEGETRHMRASGKGDFASVRLRTNGFRLGVDHRFGDVTVGAAFGHGWSRFHTVDRSNEATAKGLHLGLYGTADLDGSRLTGGWTWSRYKVEGDRIADYGNLTDNLDSGWTGRAHRFFLEAGHAFGKDSLKVEPFVGVSHSILTASAFEESGGDAALQVARDKSKLTTVRLGARGHVDVQRAKLKLGAAWEQNSGDRTSRIDAAFNPGGDIFRVTGMILPRHLASLDVGVGFEPLKNGWIGVDYGGRFASGFQDHRGRLSFDYRF